MSSEPPTRKEPAVRRLYKTHPRRPLRFWSILLTAAAFTTLLSGCAAQKPVTTTRQYSFWPPAPDAPHAQFLVAFNSSADIAVSRNKFDEMIYGKQAEQGITKPSGIAFWNGRVYVTDLRSRGVTVFDLSKHETRMMGLSGTGEIERPIDVCVSPEGIKYVIDAGKNSILAFDADERYLATFTLPDFNPVASTVYQNELYVSDLKAACVKVLNRSNGALLRTIGGPGPGDGQFVGPMGIRIDNDGNLLVADVMRCRVQKFSRDGKLLMAFGETGDRPGEFVRPKHMVVDSKNFIYIVDAAFNNVQVFDNEGKIAGYFGSYGNHAGAMNLPIGLAISENPADLALFQNYVHPAFQMDRVVIVSNQFGNSKIAVYAIGELKPGKTLADISGARSTVNVGLIEGGVKPTTGPIEMGSPLPAEFFAPTTAPSAAATQPGN
jgi:DNA-binding beta-propeller fold protein YncE